jgi:hypothetical protein
MLYKIVFTEMSHLSSSVSEHQSLGDLWWKLLEILYFLALTAPGLACTRLCLLPTQS